MKFIDFFAGIGGFHSGMELAGHECVGWVEWDKYARQSYKAIYNTKGIYTAHDITKIKNGNELPQSDVWCFGSPCTNISLAGNREGLHGESSSMFFEVMRLLHDRKEIHRPAYLFMENVKNLLSSNGGRDFAEVLIQMDKNGYDVEWQVLNSKEVVPQNREWVFIIGHKRGRTTRRVFPLDIKPYATQYRILSDVLEDNVDEKYYLSDDKVKQLVVNAQKDDSKKKSLKASNNPKVIENEEVYPCLTPDRINKRQNGRRFKNNEDPMFTVTAADRHGVTIKKVYGSTQKHASITAKKQFGRLGKQAVETFNEHQDEVQPGDCIEPYNKRIHHDKTPTITTRPEGLKTAILPITQELRIRKLTPLECWRLQGFSDEQFHKAQNAGVSNSQLYKQAGNAVTVPVIHAIANELN